MALPVSKFRSTAASSGQLLLEIVYVAYAMRKLTYITALLCHSRTQHDKDIR
jgi:hypothetical protein